MSKSHLNEKWESCLEDCLSRSGYTTFRISITPDDKVRSCTGSILRVTVEGRKDREFKIEHLVMKTIDETKDKSSMMFSTEAIMYNDVIGVYEKMQCDLPSGDRFGFPSRYAATGEYILMSDLVMKNLTADDEYLGFEKTCLAVGELARFHAFSMALGRTKPEWLANLVLDKGYFYYTEPDEKTIKQSIDSLTDSALRKKLANYSTAAVEKIKRLIAKQPDNKYAVITHGDYSYRNLLFACDENDEPTNMMTLDYQLASMNSPLVDILYLLLSSCTTQIILQMDYYMDLYHDSMRLALKKHTCRIDEIYPKSVFEQELKEYLPYAVVQFLYTAQDVCAKGDYCITRVEGVLKALDELNLL